MKGYVWAGIDTMPAADWLRIRIVVRKEKIQNKLSERVA
jgi:hypothetical protein